VFDAASRSEPAEPSDLISSQFSWIRTEFSNVRTLLSWVRTSVSMIGFGFTIYNFYSGFFEELGTERVDDAARNLGLALVGFGKIAPRPWAEGATLDVRPVVEMTLAADHRATDGHVGARFLATIERHLHHPEELQ